MASVRSSAAIVCPAAARWRALTSPVSVAFFTRERMTWTESLKRVSSTVVQPAMATSMTVSSPAMSAPRRRRRRRLL
jgi:hypothetical protein